MNHFALKSLDSMSFVCSLIPDWYLNSDGNLPINGACIAADTKFGPVLLVRELSVYLAAEVGEEAGHNSARTIAKSFVDHIVHTVSLRKDGTLGDSILTFLFGPDGAGGGKYDSSKHRKVLTPPAAHAVVQCSIPRGPNRVDPPVVTMFLKPPPEPPAPPKVPNSEKMNHLKQQPVKLTFPAAQKSPRDIEREKREAENASPMSKGAVSPRSKAGQVISVREPSQNRKKRLDNFLVGTGNPSMLQLNMQIAKQTAQNDPYELDSGVPDSARDMFTGLRMDTTNLFARRAPREIDPATHHHEAGLQVRIEDRQQQHHHQHHNQLAEASSPKPSSASPQSKQRPQSARTVSTTNLQLDNNDPSVKLGLESSSQRPAMLTRGFSTFTHTLTKEHLPIQRPQTARQSSGPVEVIARQSSKPFNNKEKFDTLREEISNQPVSEYHGMFRGGHLSAFEKEVKAQQEAKSKFLGGDFYRHFGVASKMPIRLPGHVRPHGPYPQNPPQSMHLKPDDWHHVRKNTTEAIAGPWKPTTSKSFNFG